MPILLAAAFVFAVFVWLGRRGKDGRRRDWRAASALTSIVALGGAGLALVKGAWPLAILLLLTAVGLSLDLRDRGAAVRRKVFRSGMSEAEARSLLGVAEGATPAEINAAYLRLMRTVHPDAGGTSGLAAQINAARDRLLSRR